MCRSKLVKSNKGFSLIELIIVMAIMVALIAILAPQFIKYIQRGRDSVIETSAEEVCHLVKDEYACGNIDVADPSKGLGVVYVESIDNHVNISFDNIHYYDKNSGVADNSTDNGLENFKTVCSIDTKKETNSNVKYAIEVKNDSNGVIFKKLVDAEGNTVGEVENT